MNYAVEPAAKAESELTKNAVEPAAKTASELMNYAVEPAAKAERELTENAVEPAAKTESELAENAVESAVKAESELKNYAIEPAAKAESKLTENAVEPAAKTESEMTKHGDDFSSCASDNSYEIPTGRLTTSCVGSSPPAAVLEGFPEVEPAAKAESELINYAVEPAAKAKSELSENAGEPTAKAGSSKIEPKEGEGASKGCKVVGLMKAHKEEVKRSLACSPVHHEKEMNVLGNGRRVNGKIAFEKHKYPWQMEKERQGEAEKPGPRMQRRQRDGKDYITISSNNITSLEAHKQHLLEQDEDFSFWQEIKVPNKSRKAKQEYFKKAGKVAELGPPDEEGKAIAGGLGATAKKPNRLCNVKANVDELQQIINRGRCRITSISLPSIGCCNIYNLYGWTGGDQTEEAKMRTHDMCKLVGQDIETRKGEHVIICGDINASRGRVEAFEELVDTHMFTDLGREAERWGGVKEQCTCRASAKAAPSRIDYMLASPSLLNDIRSFEVSFNDQIPTHGKLKLTMNVRKEVKTVMKNCDPADIQELLKQQTKRKTEGASEKEIKEVTKELHEELKEMIDIRLDAISDQFNEAIRNKDVNAVWAIWSHATELGLLDGVLSDREDMDDREYKRCLGRGRPNIKLTKIHPPEIHICGDDVIVGPLGEEAARCKGQQRRCTQHAQRLKRINLDNVTCNQYAALHNLNCDTIRIITKNAVIGNEEEKAFIEKIKDRDAETEIKYYAAFEMQAKLYDRRYQKKKEEHLKALKEKFRDKLHDNQKGGKLISKCLQKDAPQNLFALKRDIVGTKGEPVGSYTHDEAEVDQIARREWDRVYDGNFKNIINQSKKFLKDYDKYIFGNWKPRSMKKIDWKDLKKVCQDAPKTAKGLDNWATFDLSILSDQAYEKLAEFLQLVEDEGRWPEALRRGRSAYLSKDANKIEEPLQYRKLTILSVIYRRWGSMRHKNIKNWIAEWDHPQICAGGLHKGAEDGWWRTSLYLEVLKARKVKFTVGAVDIRKAFDQMPREIIYGILEKAGMPVQLLAAYKDFLEGLELHNSIGDGLGCAYKQKTGIPQGDPFSMMVVATYLRPWCEKMSECNAQGRTLADDMLIITTGENHLQDFERALNQTHVFLEAIGSQIAPEKSTIMTNDERARRWYEKHEWPNIKNVIKVMDDARDLGAHLCATKAVHSSTLKERFLNATRSAETLNALPMDRLHKARAVRSHILPKALYGCEVSSVAKENIDKLSTAILKNINPAKGLRSRDFSYSFCSNGQDLDPALNILLKRIMAFRRGIAKDDTTIAMARELILFYEHSAEGYDDIDGPIKHLVTSLRDMGAKIDDRFIVTQENEQPIDLERMAIQQVKPIFMNAMANRRTKDQKNRREETSNLEEIDKTTTMKFSKKLVDTDANLLRVILTGSTWTKDKFVHTGQASSSICELCNEDLTHDATHMFWECKTFECIRKEVAPNVNKIPLHALPKPLRIGIAPALQPDPQCSYWGSSTKHLDEGIAKLIGKTTTNARSHEFDDYLNQTKAGGILAHLNARQAFQHIRGNNAERIIEKMKIHYVGGLPPLKPNVYTDGGMANPGNYHWCLSGAGIWWPKRNVKDQPINENETCYTHDGYFTDDGLKLYSAIKGLKGSSTRAEIIAIMIALLSDIPIHVATDSENAKRGYCEIINFLTEQDLDEGEGDGYENWPMERHWSLITDGDLWEQAFWIIKARGPTSIRITKVKGHATMKDTGESQELREQMDGNDEADKLANLGIQANGNGKLEFAQYIQKRQKEYEDLVEEIQKMLVAVLKESIRLNEEKEKERNPFAKASPDGRYKKNQIKKKIVFEMEVGTEQDAPYEDNEAIKAIEAIQTKKLDYVKLPVFKGNDHKLREKREIYGEVTYYLMNLEWDEAVEEGNETTWLELFIGAELMGVRMDRCDKANNVGHTARRRASTKNLLDRFQNAVRLVNQYALDPNQEHYFRNAKDCKPRFENLGIKFCQKSIKGKVKWPRDVKIEIAKSILALRTNVTASKCEMVKKGLLELKPERLRLKGSPPWREGVITVKTRQEGYEANRVFLHEYANKKLEALNEGTRNLRCPECEGDTEWHRKNSHEKLRWKKWVCKKCNKLTCIKMWKCGCGLKLRECEKHRMAFYEERPRESFEVKRKGKKWKGCGRRSFLKSNPLKNIFQIAAEKLATVKSGDFENQQQRAEMQKKKVTTARSHHACSVVSTELERISSLVTGSLQVPKVGGDCCRSKRRRFRNNTIADDAKVNDMPGTKRAIQQANATKEAQEVLPGQFAKIARKFLVEKCLMEASAKQDSSAKRLRSNTMNSMGSNPSIVSNNDCKHVNYKRDAKAAFSALIGVACKRVRTD